MNKYIYRQLREETQPFAGLFCVSGSQTPPHTLWTHENIHIASYCLAHVEYHKGELWNSYNGPNLPNRRKHYPDPSTAKILGYILEIKNKFRVVSRV